MRIPRIYQSVPLSPNKVVFLNSAGSHHLTRVLRATVGDHVLLFNGQPFQNLRGDFKAIITKINKKEVEVKIVNFIQHETESPIDIFLAQGISRSEKMDFVIQKAVELGVKKIIPLITARCNVRSDATRTMKRMAHWQAVAISACEQSGRNVIPSVAEPVLFAHLVAQNIADCCFVLSPHAKKSPIKIPKSTKSIALFIGPEGGFIDDEIELANHHQLIPLNLGPRILRTETAALSAVTLIQGLLGDMSLPIDRNH